MRSSIQKGNQIEENGMDGGDEKCIQNLVGKTLGKNHLEDLSIDGKLILKWILRK
jgi:hypothetical protein